MNPSKPLVAGIGELLWDLFSNHRRLGGAPANFACHAHQLGAQAWPVSCVGADVLGAEARNELTQRGVDTRYVLSKPVYLTGTVEVVLNEGKPTYEIHQDVAWDHIPFTPELEALAAQLDAVSFGSLSQRSPESKETIHAFLRCIPEPALKIFDVNLRQSFYSEELIRESLELANVLKLSDEELPVLADLFALKGEEQKQLRELLDLFGLHLIAYTRGPHGSLLIGPTASDDFPGCEGTAVDSVGAGDSFNTSLCLGILRGWPLATVNRFANEVATFVCSQKGATPVLPDRLVNYNVEVSKRSVDKH